MSKLIAVINILLVLAIGASGQSENYVITRAPFSSPKFDEFSPVYYKGGVVFCSNRNSGLFSSYTTSDNKSFFKLYHADTTSQVQWQNTDLLAGQVNSHLNNGPASFSRNGDTVYFSRNLIVNGSYKDITGRDNKLGLFYAVLRNGEWTDVQEMRFNDHSWNVTTPYITPDGSRLYFASDKPDGFGGSDLYYSEWRNGYWNNPVNLGAVVNTEGNEAYPFVNESGDLFFSSDGHKGLGLKDIFFTRYADTSWIEPVALNPPVNSSRNDFGFIADGAISRGYFSSDRSADLDIYSFRTTFPQFLYCESVNEDRFCYSFADDAQIDMDPIRMQFSWDFGDGSKSSGYVVQHCYSGPGKYTIRQDITEKSSGRLIMNKLILELEIEDLNLPRIVTDDIVPAGKPVSLGATVPGSHFENVSYYWQIGSAKTERGSNLMHTFSEGDHPVRLLANMRDKTSGKLTQICIEKVIQATASTEVKGQASGKAVTTAENIFEAGNEKGVNLELAYSAADALDEKAVYAVEIFKSEKNIPATDPSLKKIAQKYTIRQISSDVVNQYSYIIDEQTGFMAAYYAFADAVSSGFTGARILTYVPSDPGEIELWNFKRTYGTGSDIYFVNNGTTISQKGIPILDRLVLLLKRNPDLKLLISAHTDNTGTVYSNMQLSGKQALSIVNYLVENGIEKSRLTAAGYGGSRQVAPEYPESERMKNRRIDFVKIN